MVRAWNSCRAKALPCAVCRTGVGSNRVFCNSCKYWVHKKCSGLKRLTKNLEYRCSRCQGTAHLLDGRPQREVQVRPDKLEVVASFCYLGAMLSTSTTTLVKTAWKSSLFPPPLFEDTWPGVQLLCTERSASCQ